VRQGEPPHRRPVHGDIEIFQVPRLGHGVRSHGLQQASDGSLYGRKQCAAVVARSRDGCQARLAFEPPSRRSEAWQANGGATFAAPAFSSRFARRMAEIAIDNVRTTYASSVVAPTGRDRTWGCTIAAASAVRPVVTAKTNTFAAVAPIARPPRLSRWPLRQR